MEKLLSQYLYNCQSFVKSLSLFVNFSPDLNDFFRILSLTPHEIKASKSFRGISFCDITFLDSFGGKTWIYG